MEEADVGVNITDVPAPEVPVVAAGGGEKIKKKRKKPEEAAAPAEVLPFA